MTRVRKGTKFFPLRKPALHIFRSFSAVFPRLSASTLRGRGISGRGLRGMDGNGRLPLADLSGKIVGRLLFFFYFRCEYKSVPMKKALLVCAFSLLFRAVVPAQNIALDERAPEPRVQSWLGDREPAGAPLTYVEFFHSSSKSSLASVEHLRQLSEQLGDRLRVVILVREPEAKIVPLLAPYVSGRIGVGFDPAGRNFSAYGVSYVPFGVLLGARNRALWMGNTLQLTPRIIDNSR